MEEKSDPIAELEDRLEALRIKQGLLANEIMNLSRSIRQLKSGSTFTPDVTHSADPLLEIITDEEKKTSDDNYSHQTSIVEKKNADSNPIRSATASRLDSLHENLEDFIGGSLISKIGIVAIVIGVGIGIKYAFDYDLISPPVRIAMGYLAGFVLLFFTYRLRKTYPAFSAVLLSGSIAILYYTSFAAHIYYALLSQSMAFSLMVLLTIYAVGEALRTDQPIIAHFGLVGAYAIPYLLGDDPEQITFLFTYIAIVNIGILAIALWRYWKKLFYAAFIITWLIYLTWYAFDYREAVHYRHGLVFMGVFYLIFYMTFLAYKLIKREKYHTADVVILLANSFIAYGLGYLILQGHDTGQYQLGLFTLINALFHLVVSAVVYPFTPADRNLFYLISGVGLIFATITIPVQLNGNWVTFLWANEAVLLFWIGRSNKAVAYEYLSYVLFPLAFLSLLQDWGIYTSIVPPIAIVPVFNVYMLTSLWCAVCFGGALFLNIRKKNLRPSEVGSILGNLFDYGIVVFFLLTLYLGFLLEIAHYFNEWQTVAKNEGEVILSYKSVWMINYSMFYLTVLSLINSFRLRNAELGWAGIVLNTLAGIVFLMHSLFQFSYLQEVYVNLVNEQNGEIRHIIIRYISYVFIGGLLWATRHLLRQTFMGIEKQILFELFSHLFLISLLSLELYCWMMLFHFSSSYQAGLSILWGLYALSLIGAGIRWSKKHLRIAAMTLVGITLVKVIFVDLADLDTPTKTLVLVILGALLLGISFLYNKFRQTLFG